jgi:uncharacterized membrane protein (GlpM family)
VIEEVEASMQLLIKAALSLVIIFSATGIAGRYPSAAGLIAVMPLTGALVLIWVSIENKGNRDIMQTFAKGAFGGIFPSMLFFLAAFICARKGLSLPSTLIVSFAAWGLAALAHHLILH